MVKGQGQSLTRRYWHEMLGFNYRMTNIAAAIGLAQIERLAPTLARKRAIGRQVPLPCWRACRSRSRCGDPQVAASDWLVSLLLPRGVDRDRLMDEMLSRGVDTRPVFHCAHQMPMYATGPVLCRSPRTLPRGAFRCQAIQR